MFITFRALSLKVEPLKELARKPSLTCHSRSFILHSITSQQGPDYSNIIMLILSPKFPKK